jgi:hypothetical protein
MASRKLNINDIINLIKLGNTSYLNKLKIHIIEIILFIASKISLFYILLMPIQFCIN